MCVMTLGVNFHVTPGVIDLRSASRMAICSSAIYPFDQFWLFSRLDPPPPLAPQTPGVLAVENDVADVFRLPQIF